MDSQHETPSSTPRIRRRAISPDLKTESPSFSSPYQRIIMESIDNEQQLKSKIQESEKIIEDLREEASQMKENLINKSGLNESLIIETSNRVSTQETRIFRRDLNFLEEDNINKKKKIIELLDLNAKLEKQNQELVEKINRMKSHESDMEIENSSLKSAVESLEKLLNTKENELSELKKDIDDLQRHIKSTSSSYEKDLSTMQHELKTLKSKLNTEIEEKMKCCDRITKLTNDVERLETDLKQQSNLAKMSNEFDSDIRRSMEAEDEQKATAKKVLNEVQQLSNQIQCLTPLKAKSPDEKNDFMKMSVRVIEENMNCLKRKNMRLTKELEDKKQLLEESLEETKKLKEELDEIAGNSDQANKFLREENSKLTRQKADIRCELIEFKRKMQVVENNEREIVELKETIKLKENDLKQSKEKIVELNEKLEELEYNKIEMQCMKKTIEDGKNEIKKLQEALIEIAKHLDLADKQCLTYKREKEMTVRSRDRAIQQCNDMVLKIRNLEQLLENQRKVEQECEMLRNENERQLKKIEFLNEEISEIHSDYRSELSRIANERKAEGSTENHPMVSSLKTQLSQKETEIRSAKKNIETIKCENQRYVMEMEELRKQQASVVDENVKLRRGLADAVKKLEIYKVDCENAKEVCQRMAEELGEKDTKLAKLEEELSEKSLQVAENEQVVNYLHSQINVKPSKMPKLGRRSTLLSTVTEISSSEGGMCSSFQNKSSSSSIVEDSGLGETTFIRETEEIRQMENEKQQLLAELAEKRRLKQMKSAEVTSNSSLVSNESSQHIGTMRHDIPHKWKDARYLSVMSSKCAVCFIGIPTFGKARKCSHCDILIHASCASRVFNTCGMPAGCANYYRENHIIGTQRQGPRMNGWLRIYRDDQPDMKSWLSSWAMMDQSVLAFYVNDGADLDKPLFKIDLHREQWVMRAGMEMPIVCDDQMRASNVLMIKMPGKCFYLLAPSQNSARRWSDCLQMAQRKRMMLTCKPTTFAEYSCLLVLTNPNNLKIYKTIVMDDWILFGTQTGLFYTSISQPRNPRRIAGPSSVTSIELMKETNCVSMICNSKGQLALVPLDVLQLTLDSQQPAIRADVLPEYSHVNLIKYHQQNNQKFLIVTDIKNVHVLKYNATRDVYSHFLKIDISEPVICVESAENGFYFGADTFYYVELEKNGVARQIVNNPRVGDYPISVLIISESELLLAYQNYGVFVDRSGSISRNQRVEWEQMPMEFYYTKPYLYIIHYDSIQIAEVAEYTGIESKTILTEREIFDCVNAHIIGKHYNDVLISLSSSESTEIHRFNTSARRNQMSNGKRRGMSPVQTLKRAKN